MSTTTTITSTTVTRGQPHTQMEQQQREITRGAPSHDNLMQELQDWMQQCMDREDANKILAIRHDPTGNMSEKEVQTLIDMMPLDLAHRYLEALIHSDNRRDTVLHNCLVRVYLNIVKILKPRAHNSLPAEIRVKAGHEAGLVGQVRRKLLALLDTRDSLFDAQLVLNMFETEAHKQPQMLEELVILYKRTANHRKALQVIVHQLQDFAYAEQYCVENHAPHKGTGGTRSGPISSRSTVEEQRPGRGAEGGTSGGTNIGRTASATGNETDGCSRGHTMDWHVQNRVNRLWTTLLQVCFDSTQHEHSAEKRAQFGMRMLHKHAKHVDIVQALQCLLPRGTRAAQVRSFVRQATQAAQAEHRANKALYHMQKMHLIRCQALVAKGLSRSVVVRSSTACAVCAKPIGSTVFVVYPDTTLVHLKCSTVNDPQRSAVHPVSGVNFAVFGADLRSIPDDAVLSPPLITYD